VGTLCLSFGYFLVDVHPGLFTSESSIQPRRTTGAGKPCPTISVIVFPDTAKLMPARSGEERGIVIGKTRAFEINTYGNVDSTAALAEDGPNINTCLHETLTIYNILLLPPEPECYLSPTRQF